MKKFCIKLCIVSIALISTAALAGIGMQTEFMSDTRRAFIPCLGEFVDGTIDVTIKGHSFETPSGTIHHINNWFYVLEFRGETSGRMWVGSGVAPEINNIVKNGETFGYTDKFMLNPVDGGPRWIANINFKIKLDADGNVISARIGFASGEVFRCLGPN